MSDFRIVDQFEAAAHEPRESLMDSVWEQMRTVGMMWGAVVDGHQALAAYDRCLRVERDYGKAAERALSIYAGPRYS